MVGVGLDKEILDTEEGLGKERLVLKAAVVYQWLSIPSSPYSLGRGKWMVPISEGISPILLFMLLINRLLHSSAVTYSINHSETHKG
jgi:hypothetical protein